MLEAHKSYAFDLSKNMGAQMHQIVEAQNNILGDYNKKFSDFENRILLEVQEKFTRLIPMLENLKKGNEEKEVEATPLIDRIVSLEK